MALIARVSRLFKADLHAVLDRLEEPLSLLKQSLREMEEALAERERHARALEQEGRALDKRLAETEAQCVELDGQLDLCFADGNDELARKLVRRKLKAQKLAALARARREAVADRLAEALSGLEDERAELEHLRQKAECFAEAPDEPSCSPPGHAAEVGDDELEVAFLQEKQRRVPS